jgi:hypothetical protein
MLDQPKYSRAAQRAKAITVADPNENIVGIKIAKISGLFRNKIKFGV